MTAACEDSLEERSWTEFGFVTPAEVEGFREWERMGREVCACSHPRREHFLDARGCVHVELRRSPVTRRVPCVCEGWTAPQRHDSDGLSATESPERASRVHRTAGTGETA